MLFLQLLGNTFLIIFTYNVHFRKWVINYFKVLLRKAYHFAIFNCLYIYEQR